MRSLGIPCAVLLVSLPLAAQRVTKPASAELGVGQGSHQAVDSPESKSSG